MNFKQAESILGLKQPYDETSLKARYRHLVLLAHPDKGGSSSDFIKIHSAYNFLVNNSHTQEIHDSSEDNCKMTFEEYMEFALDLSDED